MSLITAFARTALAAFGKVAKPVAGAARAAVRFTRGGKVAKGSRKALNDMLTSKYGKPVGRLTWSQIVESQSHQAEHGSTLINEAMADEDADESY